MDDEEVRRKLNALLSDPVNRDVFGGLPPRTVKLGEPVQEEDGTWTIPMTYRAGGWPDEDVTPADAVRPGAGPSGPGG